MGEPKAFASLSSGLLARKGAARPAMRPQGFGQLGATLEDLGWNDMGFEAPKPALAAVRDENHDAFGEATAEPGGLHHLAGLTPSASPVHNQHAELANRFADHIVEPGEEEEFDPTAEPFDPAALQIADAAEAVIAEVAAAPAPAPATAPRRAYATRAAPGSKAKAAFTLRLEPARHLKLRLACVVTGRSAQLLVTEALDRLLEAMPELDGMAASAPARKLN